MCSQTDDPTMHDDLPRGYPEHDRIMAKRAAYASRPASIRPCCGTPEGQRAMSPHARDCRTVTLNPPARTGGPYCISAHCPVRRLHLAGIGDCILTEGTAR